MKLRPVGYWNRLGAPYTECGVVVEFHPDVHVAVTFSLVRWLLTFGFAWGGDE